MAGRLVANSGKRMSTERIKQLHEQASERYLNGDYHGALQAWRDVLELDPADEQALDGSSLAAQFVADPKPASAEAEGNVEDELDQGLKVLDGLGATGLLHEDVVDGTIDRQAVPAEEAARPAGDLLEGWDAPPKPADQDGAFGLEAMPADPSTKVSAAAAELSRRVNDLLTEAKAKAEAGERDEALAILFRLAILDEDNAEAAQLRAKIEAAGASDLDRVERAIIEGVASLEQDQLDDAERFFREALELVPGHREAQHYLEKVAQRRAHGSEELLATGAGDAAPFEHAVEQATASPAAPQPQAPSLLPKAPRPAPSADVEPLEPPSGTSGPGAGGRPSKVLVWGGGAVLLLACAAFALPHLFGGNARGGGATARPAPASVKKPPAQPGPRARKPASPPTSVAPLDPAAAAKVIASALAKGKALMESRDFGGAVVAFNEALSLDPKNAEARSGFDEAGERYKASKAEREALDNIKFAFRDGEFTSGLRLAYRLPPTVSQSYIDGVKFAGWYNLAVVALRAGDCREAMSHLDEALTIAPEENDAKKLREFAARYVDAVKDRSFLDHVEALSFRALPQS